MDVLIIERASCDWCNTSLGGWRTYVDPLSMETRLVSVRKVLVRQLEYERMRIWSSSCLMIVLIMIGSRFLTCGSFPYGLGIVLSILPKSSNSCDEDIILNVKMAKTILYFPFFSVVFLIFCKPCMDRYMSWMSAAVFKNIFFISFCCMHFSHAKRISHHFEGYEQSESKSSSRSNHIFRTNNMTRANIDTSVFTCDDVAKFISLSYLKLSIYELKAPIIVKVGIFFEEMKYLNGINSENGDA